MMAWIRERSTKANEILSNGSYLITEYESDYFPSGKRSWLAMEYYQNIWFMLRVICAAVACSQALVLLCSYK